MCGPVSFLFINGNARPWVNAFRHLFHCDATVDRAYAGAQVAAHALFIDDLEFAFAICRLRNCLMRCVFADNVTTAALDAEVLVDHGLFDVIEIQVLPGGNARYGFADEFTDR